LEGNHVVLASEPLCISGVDVAAPGQSNVASKLMVIKSRPVVGIEGELCGTGIGASLHLRGRCGGPRASTR
jgi:hypothetical protein